MMAFLQAVLNAWVKVVEIGVTAMAATFLLVVIIAVAIATFQERRGKRRR